MLSSKYVSAPTFRICKVLFFHSSPVQQWFVETKNVSAFSQGNSLHSAQKSTPCSFAHAGMTHPSTQPQPSFSEGGLFLQPGQEAPPRNCRVPVKVANSLYQASRSFSGKIHGPEYIVALPIAVKLPCRLRHRSLPIGRAGITKKCAGRYIFQQFSFFHRDILSFGNVLQV